VIDIEIATMDAPGGRFGDPPRVVVTAEHVPLEYAALHKWRKLLAEYRRYGDKEKLYEVVDELEGALAKGHAYTVDTALIVRPDVEPSQARALQMRLTKQLVLRAVEHFFDRMGIE
jgi:hypothetical protein